MKEYTGGHSAVPKKPKMLVVIHFGQPHSQHLRPQPTQRKSMNPHISVAFVKNFNHNIFIDKPQIQLDIQMFWLSHVDNPHSGASTNSLNYIKIHGPALTTPEMHFLCTCHTTSNHQAKRTKDLNNST
jgi:hypothetical protein